ncbi:MAG: hypothetical protein Q3983_09840 [Capnocytophaga sp.]|nr:hypothetical protein [Capnocytophaga sp.]
MSMEQKDKQLISEKYLEQLIAPEEYNEKYETFFNDDKAKSQILATSLQVSQEELKAVQDWFLLLLQKLCKLESNDTHIIEELDICLEKTSANLSLNANKLILAKLIYYNNIIVSGHLRSLVFGIMAKFLNDKVEQYMPFADFTLAEFTALSEYLKHNFYVSPNGDLLENIIKIEKRNKIFAKANDEEKLVIIQNLLQIINDKGFHHDLVIFKKILDAIKVSDEKTIYYVTNFIPKIKQGCYLVTNKILNLACFEGKFELCAKTLKWLDSARGKEPVKGWLTKFNELKNELGKEAMQEIADEIFKFKSLEHHDFGSFSWADEVMKRFIKSAEWIKELY